MHGYQANLELERRQVQDWAGISRPQVYYSLEKLARLGLVTSGRGAGVARRGAEKNDGREFTATQASVFLDGFTFRRFLEDCYGENRRRMAVFDEDMLKPSFLPQLAETALAALPTHLDAWPRDALVLGTTAFTNGLIGSSGRAGQKRALLDLLERLATSYGDDWWFTAHHGMALSENGQWEAARPKIDRSLAQNPGNPWAAHARAHLSYEEGDANAARAFLASWLTTYPRSGLLYSHLSWHLALGDIEAGDPASAFRLFREAFSPEVHSGPPRGKLNDAVSFLWRWELAGHPRDAAAWRMMYDFANRMFPRAGVAFSDIHIALAQVVAGNGAALEARARQIGELTRGARYPSGFCVPAVSRAFAAFEQRDFSAAIDALQPIAGELERIGGSRAQLDLVLFTLLKAYLGADRLDDARRMLSVRRPGSSGMPVAGLAAVH
jgi:hypothetical protein